MRKLTLSVMAAFALLLVAPTQTKAENETTPVEVVATAPAASVDAGVLIARVETIKAMDVSTLNSSERKELRKELRGIKNDLKDLKKNDANSSATTNGGVYLSVGAIIIIILLLILIL